MQNRHKSRHFGQKFRLYMRIFSVVEVESTFLTLFFCQKSDYFFAGIVLHTNTMADLDYEVYDVAVSWMEKHGNEVISD